MCVIFFCLQVVSFAVENNMALSAVPKIVDLANALEKEKLALQNMACSTRWHPTN